MGWATTLQQLFQAKAHLSARALVAGLLALAATGCVVLPPVDPVLKPQARPARAAAPAPIPAPIFRPTSEASAAMRARLTQIQSAQLSQGLLRQDGGGPDTPYTATMLARNFENIAFFNEYAGDGLAPGAAGLLRRWEVPVVVGLEFGASVPPSERRQDAADVARFANRLARVTGHPVRLGTQANMIVAFVSEDDRADSLARIAERLPGVSLPDLARLVDLSPDIYCAVLAFPDPESPSAYATAIALIRSENPDLLRLSCIHEELAQGMGLANDSPAARPSIFNDDDEFALLTSHDEDLLGMLYDPRLRTGMSLEEAQPIIRTMAIERTEPDSLG